MPRPVVAPPGAIHPRSRRSSGMDRKLTGSAARCAIIEAMLSDAGEGVPRLRGLLPASAAVVAVGAAAVLVTLAPEARSRASALVYGLGLCALFTVSGLYNRWRWDPSWRPLLRPLDHSMIFVFIAASATPLAVLVLSGTLQTVVLVAVWAGALAGIALSAAWITAPRVLVACCYLAVGWAGVAGIPRMAERLPGIALLLLPAGGIRYSIGAVVYALRRPDPWPRVFGFHEVFHTLVLLRATAHFAAVAGGIVSGAGRPPP